MASRTRTPHQTLEILVRGQSELGADDLAAALGISPARLTRLVQLGLVEPSAPDGSRFSAATATRLARMLRLHRDVGINLAGAAVILDLLDRIDALEARLRGRR